MFNKNIEAIKNINKKLYDKLITMKIEDCASIGTYEAESKDYVISYKETLLDSAYDPIREAKTIWNKTIVQTPMKNDIVMVFGLGLGYLFKRAFVNCPSYIVVVEPFLEVLRFVFEYVDLSAEISSKRVFITNSNDEAIDFINQKHMANDKIEVLFNKSYYSIASQNLLDLTNKLVDACNLKNLDATTINKLSKIWVYNTIKNTKYSEKSRALSVLNNKFKGEIAVIAGFGPSLKENIENIKNNREKFTLFAVNKSLEFLVQNKITPDFAMFADAENSINTIENITDEVSKMNIISDIRGDEAPYKLAASRVLNYYSNNDVISAYLNKTYPEEISQLETGGTAVLDAFFAAKAMGFKTIIFTGLDLAFKGEEAYSDGTIVQVSKTTNLLVGNVAGDKKPIQIKSVNGDMVITKSDYALFVRQFEDILKEETGLKIFNTTSFGAFIEGMNNTTFEEAIKTISAVKSDTGKILNEVFDSTKTRWEQISNTTVEFLKDEAEKIKEISEKIKEILPYHSKLLEIAEQLKNEYNEVIEAKFKEDVILYTPKLADLFCEIADNSLLIQCFQIEFLNYSKLHEKANNQSIDSFITNKKYDIELLENIQTVSEQLIEIINKTFSDTTINC